MARQLGLLLESLLLCDGLGMDTRDFDETINRVCEKGFRKHGHEFENINSVADMRNHIRDTLSDPQTKGFCRQDGGEVYGNDSSKTVIIFTQNNKRDGGTCYREQPGGTSFNDHVNQEAQYREIAPAVHKSLAFNEMHPDYQENLQKSRHDGAAGREQDDIYAKLLEQWRENENEMELDDDGRNR